MYVVPGYGGKVDRKDKDVRKFLSIISEKFEVVPVKIDWGRKTMTDYAAQFLEQYDFSSRGSCVFGFSFGAYISFITSPYTQPSLQILASLSPWFKEDIKRLPPKSRKNISMKMTRDLKSYSFNDISSRISPETRNFIFVGDKEGKDVMFRAKDAYRKLEGSEIFVCKGAGHNLFHKTYLETVEKFISTL